jgi:uncharacterized protein (UPF0332 family)
MLHEELKNLSNLRLDNAKALLKTAEALVELDDYKSAANRSYYAIFNAMRAELALLGEDYKSHKAVITNFRKHLLRTGILDKGLSGIIVELVEVRTQSDYDDHYVISREEVAIQVENAKKFVNAIESHLVNIQS